jgi:transposase
MRKFRNGEDRKQIALLPRSIEEYVPGNDLVRYVDALIDELDLSGIESRYSWNGRPAYSPRILVKVLLYGKMRGIRTGRELSRACRENLRFIFLAQNEQPDFRTINDFRKLHSDRLAGLLRQTIQIGLREQLIDLNQVCIDGTKLGASAGRKSFKTPEKLREELEGLEKELKASFAQDNELEEEENNRYGGSDGEGKLPAELESKEKLAQRLRQALKEHNDSVRTEKPETISITDPECRMMKGKGVNPSYNAQAAIDAKSRLVVGGYVVNACCDSSELIPAIDDIEKLTDKTPVLVSADRGYTRISYLTDLETRKIDGYISSRKRRKQEFQYDPKEMRCICPEGKELHQIEKCRSYTRFTISTECNDCHRKPECWRKGKARRTVIFSMHEEAAIRMRAKVESEKGKLISTLRASTIEPLFGTLKFAKRLRQFTVRGLRQVNNAWRLELAAYNIEKLCRLKLV